MFDISSFFAKVDMSSFDELLGDRNRAWLMYIDGQLRMEAVLKYLSELATNGDSLAIEYIGEAVAHFLSKAQSNRTDTRL